MTEINQRSKWITYDDVKEAVTKLQALQKNVTGDNIREVLGSGSKATITKYLRQWKSENNVTTVDEASIPNHVLQMVRGLLKRLHEDADAELTEHKQAIDLTLSQMQIALHKIEQENAILTVNRDELGLNLEKECAERQQLENTLATLQNEKSALVERVSALELNNAEYKNEISRLHQVTKSFEDRVAQLNTELTSEQKLHTATLEKVHHDHEIKLAHLQKELGNALMDKTQLQTQLESITKEHYKATEDLTAQKNNCSELQKSTDALSFENIQLKKTLENQQLQHKQLFLECESKKSENTDLYIQLKTTENTNLSLKDFVDNAEQKMQMLREQLEKTLQEKYFLEAKINAEK